MKAKNILMTLLLVTGAIAAKASGYPAELALVSQPVMVYNPNSITVYYDVENIGDYTYRGNVYIYLDPDYGYYYAEKYVKVRPGRIKRIEVEIPCHSIDRHVVYTMMPYYEVGRDLYSFTTFEYFEPVRFCWHGPRTEPWVVINIGPCPSYYHRPGTYRYYYDGFRPPMPPPGHGHGHGHTPPPMDPMHHTYNYHHSNGGYPANHFNEGTPPPAPNNNGNNEAPNATVRPRPNAGSISSGSGSNPPAPNNGSSSARPKTNNGSSSGSNNSGRVNSGSSSHGSNGNSGRVSNSNSNTRPNGTGSNSSGRTGNNNSNSRAKSSSSSSRPAGISSSASSSRSGSSSTRSSSSSSGSSSNRSGSGSRRR